MKKLFILIMVLSGITFPLMAQMGEDFNSYDQVPVVTATILKDQIPAAALKVAQNQFDLSKPSTWSKFPPALKEYGWVYDVGSSSSDMQLDKYELRLINKAGQDLSAVYTADGELVESREAAKNVPMPRNIQVALAQSEYKDWSVIGDKAIIKYYHDQDAANVEEHFRLTVEKDNVKKNISFNFQGKQ